MFRKAILTLTVTLMLSAAIALGQTTSASTGGSGTAQQKPAEGPRKANTRSSGPAQPPVKKGEPFDSATPAELSGNCVTLQTDLGDIGIEIEGAAAPETARNFLNLAATGAFDETTFSRVVPRFVIQGGNLATGQKWTAERAKRAAKTVADEPNYIKHVRGVVSLARSDEANTGTTHFFILVADAPSLDGKFAAFGKVLRGMEVVDTINAAPVAGENPVTPVVVKHAAVTQCR
jgi:peptidyl-prolyl cis-trans isomerase B (cyclophilin B)